MDNNGDEWTTQKVKKTTLEEAKTLGRMGMSFNDLLEHLIQIVKSS